MIDKDLRKKIVSRLAENWAECTRNYDTITLIELAVSGLVGYDEYSDEELLRAFRERYVEGQDEDCESADYKMWAEATAQAGVAKLVTQDHAWDDKHHNKVLEMYKSKK